MASSSIESLKWITEDQVHAFAASNPLPAYLYSEKELRKQIEKVLAFEVNAGFGFTPRFAMKANPNRTILGIMREMGVEIDAGSEHEALRAIRSGYRPNQVQLTAQQLPVHFTELIELGVLFTACSLHQLEEYGRLFAGREVGVRFNPGLGSGGCVKTNVAGVQSAFGIWHEKVDQVLALAKKYDLKITTIHTHIGSGSDPIVWERAAILTLALAAKFSDCVTVNLGGGFKVARVQDEKTADLSQVSMPVKHLFSKFFEEHGRKLKLEIEPGSFYTVGMGIILCNVDDVIDTGEEGHQFLKLTIGMDSITRPSLYGARHPLIIVPRNPKTINESNQTPNPTSTSTPLTPLSPVPYVVAGHCCESGDLLTQHPGGDILPTLLAPAQIGDYCVIEGAGAYCASMSTKNYNSFPDLPEFLLLQANNTFKLIRKPQTLDQMLQNEI